MVKPNVLEGPENFVTAQSNKTSTLPTQPPGIWVANLPLDGGRNLTSMVVIGVRDGGCVHSSRSRSHGGIW